MTTTDNLVREMLGVVGYAQQTLRLHPEQERVVQRYLQSERLRLHAVIENHQEHLNILDRVVVY